MDAGPEHRDTDATLDLGSLILSAPAEVNIRIQADDQGWVSQLVLAHDGSSMQVCAFAVDPGHAIWTEVRGEIRAGLFEDGEAAQEVPGEFGTDLLTQALAEEGSVSLRFIGVDGPGWMVRGLIQGVAATDPQLAEPFLASLRTLTVVRGGDRLAERTRLPLRLPEDLRARRSSADDQPPTPEG